MSDTAQVGPKDRNRRVGIDARAHIREADSRVADNARPIDVRLIPVAVALWMSQALLIILVGGGATAAYVAVCPVALLLGFAVALVLRRRSPNLRRRRLVATVALSVVAAAIAGSSLAALRIAPLLADPVAALGDSHSAGSIEATLNAPPRVNREGPQTPAWSDDDSQEVQWSAPATLRLVHEGERRLTLAVPVRLLGTAPNQSQLDRLIPGVTVRAEASIRSGEPQRGTALIVRARGSPSVVEEAPVWQRAAAAVRDSMRASSQSLDGDALGLLPGLVVGDESGLSEELRDDMQLTGLSHLTAVSGANLAIITGAVLVVALLFRVSRSWAVVVAAIAMLSFVTVVGPQPSVLRAAAMGAVALLALFTRRTRAGFTALAVSVVAVLLIDPWMSVSMGFALSVAATGGLLVYAQYAARNAPQAGPDDGGRGVGDPAVANLRTRLQTWLRLGLGVATAAQFATLPLVASFGDGLPVMGVLANLLAEPAVPYATVLGCIAALVGLVAPQVGGVIAYLAGFGAWWIAFVARTCADLPAAVLPWPDGLLGFCAAVALVVILLWGWARRDLVLSKCRSNPRGIGALAAAVIAIGIVFRSTQAPWPPPGWLIVACDVGQGDALVISTGDTRAIVVDVGPEPDDIDRCLHDLGVTAIDLLVLSHFHADHVAGLEGAVAGRAVGGAIVSPLNEPVGQYVQATRVLGEHGIGVRVAAPGEEGVVGAVRYRVLWPSRLIRGDGSAPNNASVAMTVEVGDPATTILLTGDLEPSAQQAVLAGGVPGDVDIVKVPHHGSRNQSASFATSFPAQLAIFSVGADNTYGHPAPATIDQWQAVGAQIARTDQLGDVAVGRSQSQTLFFVGRGSQRSES